MATKSDSGESTPDSTPAPAPQISVIDWVQSQASTCGMETAMAFAATYGHDTATESELIDALAAFRQRSVH